MDGKREPKEDAGSRIRAESRLRRPGRRDMSKKGHKGPHVTKKTDNPSMPEFKKLDLKPGGSCDPAGKTGKGTQ